MWSLRDSEWVKAFLRALRHPGGGACRVPPKNSAHRLGDQRPRERRDGCAIAFVGRGGCGLCGTQNEANICEDPQAALGKCVQRAANK